MKFPYLFALFGISLPFLATAQTLESQLQERSKAFAATADEGIKKDYADGIQAVRESGVVQGAIQVGDQAPDFSLKNPQGEVVQLSTLLKDGPVVLVWYRGGWCPACNLTLAALQKALPDIQATGAQLVALTPELPDKSLTTIEKRALQFPVLTDLNHEVAKRYKVAFNLTPEVAARYKAQFNLAEYNGTEAGDTILPLAATYIIDPSGVVQYAFLDADYRKRAEPSEIVTFLQKMKSATKTKSAD
ncbi:AhpC/TSA family protein [Phragmitibacter flavus]|uniref:thioredoxin-dependent peroxiredoxin n=1 Tax=Phragmitibacter flavus TaxID=2576071 RepID=A0A5R8K955_9BACT|nr:peroxiredoxin-like family protein [Phragmitibacter flavus]TLD68847.1 AhpC/TSA family protein [Phragmitibacter flavus]